jgi:hypothetical protein
MARDIPFMRARYPRTYARTIATADARRAREERERHEREEENKVAEASA